MKTIGQREIFILLLCLFIGFALRVYTFDQKSLWIDEIHTFNDARDDIRSQLSFYKENPSYLQPPLFFILTHQFYPFNKPERDLRIIPLIFGTLSIPMIYLLARQFSPLIAFPCMVSLTFMTYHISGWTSLFTLNVFGDVKPLLFAPIPEDVKKAISGIHLFCFRTVILHELQFYPVYFLFSDPMVLSSKWK
jgi:hypothetical protein